MAVKTGVPIVPLSISHTNSIMPGNTLFPVQPGNGKLHVHVHEPIESTGRTDAELSELVRQAFLSELPLDHRPLDADQDELIASTTAETIQIEQRKEGHYLAQHAATHAHAATHEAHHHIPGTTVSLSSSSTKDKVVEKV